MIRVAIIGAGAISRAHIEGYLAFPERCQIVAVADIFVEKAEEAVDKFGLAGQARAAADYKELLGQGIDLVSVCTPPYTHAEIAKSFLLAGSHVLVEKPMAASLRECDEMNEAAAQSGKILSVVAQNRFRSPMMKLKQVLDEGLAGKIVHAQVDSYWWRGHCYYDLWWRGTWEKEGGGCTINHAVHHIDALQWMMGMPKEVQALMANTSHDNAEVEDLSVAVLRFDSGALGQVTSSVVHHGEEQQLIFQGAAARISAPWKVKASVSKENGFPQPNPELERQLQELYDRLPEVEHEGHKGQIDNVLQGIEQGTPVLIDGHSGRSTLELITAIYKSASTNQLVKLPLAQEDPFYTREGIQAHATHFYEKTRSVTGFSKNEITVSGEK
ncbi:Gfo/Idh/MocA family oxidoreductase [Paenibacillus doosanensis]|uniref:Oxidoreductase YcjS n=1 Tax=Paenibacillus konkukensis TaxID=2020716 RepID=A0ABY4RM55_9BACL|nr:MULTISPECIES: Gfo/Idh/MocA family oxidoreductase [Paenibacillus]MCS7461720.1 Gfo/Idh/MocA family oxidoreductase [Paenibacillus doosanensis]UQZ83562.1 putative oxidoreductase YcjS [Paenibacillus konkukensis]